MRFAGTRRGVLWIVGFVACCGSAVSAQIKPWDTFEDLLSESVCDVINASNAELVVLHATGQLVIITGSDVILEDTFVDVDGNVFFDGFSDPVGFIDFAVDGDGFRTLWWLSIVGSVFAIDDFTGDPLTTDFFPTDFFDVPCDACPLWDDPTVCEAPPPPPAPSITVDICGSNIPISIGVIFSTLMFLRFSRARTRTR